MLVFMTVLFTVLFVWYFLIFKYLQQIYIEYFCIYS